jgi:hypothetical protein
MHGTEGTVITMLTIEEKISRLENFAKLCEQNGMHEWQEECEQLAAWLRELQDRRKADSCEGCKNIGLWENEYENGLSCPCLRCTRRAKDNYEPERRAND